MATLLVSQAIGATDWYAAPRAHGASDCRSAADPCTVEAIKKKRIRPGDTVWLAGSTGPKDGYSDGRYTGSRNMLNDLLWQGSPDRPITIKAVNRGKVLFDGEGVQTPLIWLSGSRNNNYIVIDGINACCLGGAADGIYQISGGAHDNIIRHFIGWDTKNNYNSHGVLIAGEGTMRNTVEIGALFGTFRKGIQPYSTYGPNTISQVAIVWDGSINSGPKMNITHAYHSSHVNSYDNIGIFRGAKMPQSYLLANNGNGWKNGTGDCDTPGCGTPYDSFNVNNPYGVFADDGCGVGEVACIDNYWNSFGEIAIARSGDRSAPACAFFANELGHQTIVDGIAFFPNDLAFATKQTFDLDTCTICSNPRQTGNSASHITGIGGSGAFIHSNWSVIDHIEQPQRGSLNVYTGSVGAQVCYLHKGDGTRDTSRPRWPFPLNEALIDNMIYARSIPVNIDAEVQQALGIFPDDCRNASTTSLSKGPTLTPSPPP